MAEAVDSVLFRAVTAPLEEIAVGASRIGGPPDLPAGFEWPRAPDGRRLPMVLQLALADVEAFPTRLPANGTLWFFASQLYRWEGAPELNRIAGAILYAPAAVELTRCAMPREARDEKYWDAFEIARCAEWTAQRSSDEADEPSDPELHVLCPIKKWSSAFGETPPAGFVPVLEMRSDYDIRMNWGDAAWATWVVPDEDLGAARFDRAYAEVWIG